MWRILTVHIRCIYTRIHPFLWCRDEFAFFEACCALMGWFIRFAVWWRSVLGWVRCFRICWIEVLTLIRCKFRHSGVCSMCCLRPLIRNCLRIPNIQMVYHFRDYQLGLIVWLGFVRCLLFILRTIFWMLRLMSWIWLKVLIYKFI